jgi:hypothetical protein
MKEIKDESGIQFLAAAKRYHEDTGVTVAEEIGTDDLPLIELYLIMHGYLDGEPTLAKAADN